MSSGISVTIRISIVNCLSYRLRKKLIRQKSRYWINLNSSLNICSHNCKWQSKAFSLSYSNKLILNLWKLWAFQVLWIWYRETLVTVSNWRIVICRWICYKKFQYHSSISYFVVNVLFCFHCQPNLRKFL